jgi:hypothetical protein
LCFVQSGDMGWISDRKSCQCADDFRATSANNIKKNASITRGIFYCLIHKQIFLFFLTIAVFLQNDLRFCIYQIKMEYFEI